MTWSRWRRVATPGACPYCLMLATRGAVYRGQGAAMRSSHANDRCGASIEGSFDRRDDIAIDPADAACKIVYRHRKYGAYEYDLSQYRNLGVTEAPTWREGDALWLRYIQGDGAPPATARSAVLDAEVVDG